MSIKSFFKGKSNKKRISKIIVTENATDYRLEGYNRLRDNILFINAANNAKVLQIESSVANECKTTVSCNLAVSLGYAGKKVVLVETDFRRPNAHRLFGVDGDNGIAEYIMGKTSKEEIIRHTAYPNVDVVVRGSEISNPSMVFISEKFKEFIKELRDNYDFVILDCAPVLQVSDYIHLGKVSDGALLLVAYAATSRKTVADAVEELKKNDIKLLGTVFTMYDRRKDYSNPMANYKYYNLESESKKGK